MIDDNCLVTNSIKPKPIPKLTAKLPRPPRAAKTAANLAAQDKLRRLEQQNQAYQKPLRKLPEVIFNANRFGPLMFAFVFGLAGLFFVFQSFAATPAERAKPAALVAEMSSQTLAPGQTVTVRVWADSDDQPVDAVQARLMYPEDTLEFVAIDTSMSAFTVDTATEHNQGNILLSRAVSSPSPQSLKGRQLVAHVTFRAKQAASTAALWFSDDSRLFRSTDHADLLGYASDRK